MKKLFVLAFITMLCVACSTEEETTLDEGTNLEVVLENYKGVFTTTDGQTRGALDVTLSEDKLSATGTLTLSTGEVVNIFTDQITDLGNRKEIEFTSNDLSFVMTTGAEEEIMEIDAVTFRGAESSILVGQSTERAPLSPIVGTYTCPMCPPPLDNTAVETFNLIVTVGSTSVTSQTTLGGTTYNGVATQSGCVVNGSQTTCNLNSGTVVGVTGTAFNPGGGPVIWSGTHTFDNGTNPANNCSTVSGTWSWASSTIGTVVGAFASNTSGDCAPPLTQIIFEDFEDATVGYIVRDESAGVDRGENISDTSSGTGGDYIGRVTTSNFPANTFNLDGVQGSSVFSACDVDGIGAGGWSTASDNASVRWDNISVAGFTTLTVSALIGERENTSSVNPYAFQSTSAFRIDVSYNSGASWTPIFAVVGPSTPGFTQGQVDTNLDGTGDGAFIDRDLTEFTATAPTNGNTTMSVRFFYLDFDSGHEDIAIDNVTISGS